MLVHQRHRQQDVAKVLAHLLAILGQDEAQADDVFVGALVEDQRADRHERVEPATGLVDRLADVLGRIGLGELLLRALDVRVAPLRERHRAGVEPGVDDFGDTAVGAGRALDLECDLVDVRTMGIEL